MADCSYFGIDKLLFVRKIDLSAVAKFVQAFLFNQTKFIICAWSESVDWFAYVTTVFYFGPNLLNKIQHVNFFYKTIIYDFKGYWNQVVEVPLTKLNFLCRLSVKKV